MPLRHGRRAVTTSRWRLTPMGRHSPSRHSRQLFRFRQPVPRGQAFQESGCPPHAIAPCLRARRRARALGVPTISSQSTRPSQRSLRRSKCGEFPPSFPRLSHCRSCRILGQATCWQVATSHLVFSIPRALHRPALAPGVLAAPVICPAWAGRIVPAGFGISGLKTGIRAHWLNSPG